VGREKKKKGERRKSPREKCLRKPSKTRITRLEKREKGGREGFRAFYLKKKKKEEKKGPPRPRPGNSLLGRKLRSVI